MARQPSATASFMTTESLLTRKSRWDLPCDAQNPEQNTFFNPLGRRKNSGKCPHWQRKSKLFGTYRKVCRSVVLANDPLMAAGAKDELPQA